MKKRGQAFLITSVILIMILIAFFTMVNYSKKTKSTRLEYISKQVQIESEKVVDYDLVHQTNYIEDFKENISLRIGGDAEIYFINNESCHNYKLNSDCLFYTNATNVIVTINNTNYTFLNFNKGELFNYIIIEEKGGEKYVYKS